MNFDFSEQQNMLRTMVRDFLTSSCPKSKVMELHKDDKGYDLKIKEHRKLKQVKNKNYEEVEIQCQE
jgi:hypothetical protein